MKKTIIHLVILLGFFSCSVSRVQLNEKVYPGTYDPLLSPQEDFIKHKKNQGRDIIGGNFQSRGDASGFKLCVEDRNHNGKYMEMGIDAIGITRANDTTALISTMLNGEVFFGTAALLQEGLLFNYEGANYQITSLRESQREIEFKKVKHSTKLPDFQLTSSLPQFEFVELFSGEKQNIYQVLDRSKDYYLVVFWSLFCPPCIEEFPLLKQLAQHSVQIINVCGMCDVQEAKAMIRENEVPGVHAVSSAYIESIFHQNGYPFVVLFDKGLKRVGRIFPTSAAVNIIVKE